MNKKAEDGLIEVRTGEELDYHKLTAYLDQNLPDFHGSIKLTQFPGGYSNLTYLIKAGSNEYVLRKPPIGANIKSAHDMAREFKVLSALQGIYELVPEPILLCEDEQIIGSPFYLMERVNGIILRNQVPESMNLKAADFAVMSRQLIDNLADIHQLDIQNTGLIALGRPEGYVNRQVEGWIRRYFKAETECISQMNETAEWLQENQPTSTSTGFIHNDYKYDNIVLNPDDLSVRAVLDWEMATVGDPLMDLGTTLAYWAEPEDSSLLKPFNLTWLPGNLNRQQAAERYTDCTGTNLDQLVFYYAFGSFKIAVIAQQIYARYYHGITKDSRFANLIHLIKASAHNASNAIGLNRINNFN